MKTGSDVAVETLDEGDVDVFFANSCTTEMWPVKSLTAVPRFRSALVLHETACSGACDGYARMRFLPSLNLLRMGPRLASASANHHSAKTARSPIIIAVGDMATWHATSDAPLRMDVRNAYSVDCPLLRLVS